MECRIANCGFESRKSEAWISKLQLNAHHCWLTRFTIRDSQFDLRNCRSSFSLSIVAVQSAFRISQLQLRSHFRFSLLPYQVRNSRFAIRDSLSGPWHLSYSRTYALLLFFAIYYSSILTTCTITSSSLAAFKWPIRYKMMPISAVKMRFGRILLFCFKLPLAKSSSSSWIAYLSWTN